MADLPSELPTTINIRPAYGTHHRNALIEGITAHADDRVFLVDFWFERAATPIRQTFAVEDGRVGREILDQRVVADGVERTIEFSAVMAIEEVRNIVRTLTSMLEHHDAKFKKEVTT